MKRLLSILLFISVSCCGGRLFAQSTLLHYWNFNHVVTTTPPAAPIKADYSVLDTNTAFVQYQLFPGTSSSYAGYVDSLAGTTLNARRSAPAGQALSVKNPSDSAELRFYIPTKGYTNVSISYALQSSGASGQQTELFDYSTDSGATWKTAALTINGSNVDTLDATQSGYQSPSWSLVTIGFGSDSTVNNNSSLVLRVRFRGNTTGTVGSNAIDNLAEQGTPIPNTITVLSPAQGDTVYSGQTKLVTLATTGTVSTFKWVYWSTDNGVTYSLIGRDSANTFAWHVPTVANPTQATLIFVDSNGVRGTSAAFTIMPAVLIPAEASLIHYWHFNGLTGPFTYRNAPSIAADYSAPADRTGELRYALVPGTSIDYPGSFEAGTGTTLNEKMQYPAGHSLLLHNPTDSVELRFYIPTTNHKNITVNYAVKRESLLSGPDYEIFEYSVDSGATWKQANRPAVDSIGNVPSVDWRFVRVDLSGDTLANDNPNLVFRIRFANRNGVGSQGGLEIDNVSVEGPIGTNAVPPSPILVDYWNFNTLHGTFTNPNIPNLKADFSALDTNKAYFQYALTPGTSSSYAGYITRGLGDTTNARLGAPAGNSLTVMNPTDSMQYRVFMPTTGYRNIAVSFALRTTDTTTGPLAALFDYSVDSGATWSTTRIAVNGEATDSLNLAQPQYQEPHWGLVTVGLGDSGVSNNPNLVFRIRLAGRTTATPEAIQIDNFAVEEMPSYTGPDTTPRITLLAPAGGDTLVAGSHYIVRFAVSGNVSPTRSIDFSIDSGATWHPIAENITATSYDWTVPATASNAAFLRVRDTRGDVAMTNRFSILVPGKVYGVTLSSSRILVGDSTQIRWTASGYLGSTVTLDISYDSGATWTPIVQNYAFGSATSYGWRAPMTPHKAAIIRATFASGATGTTGYFAIESTAAVSERAVRFGTAWPNPFRDRATIQIPTENQGSLALRLYDERGSLLRTMTAPASAGVCSFDLEAEGLAAGVYRYVVVDRGHEVTGSIVLQR